MCQSFSEPLFLDNHLFIVYKPFGLSIQADTSERDSLLDQAKEWIRKTFRKPGNVYLGLVHRLDKPVAGVVVLARTSKAASRLSAQFRNRAVGKYYRAVVCGVPEKPQGNLIFWVKKNPKTRKATVFPRKTVGAQKAELSYGLLKSFGDSYSLMEIKLETGRFHQIRAQLAFMKHPILGDVKYGAQEDLPGRHIALYAHRLTFRHPVTNKEMNVESPEPQGWPFVA